jgi:hypothetical protein
MKYRKGLVSMVRSLNISDEEDLTFRAAVIILCIYFNGKADFKNVSHSTGYNKVTVETVLNNLIQNGLLKDGILYLDHDFTDEKNGLMTLVLAAMVGSGEVACYQAPTTPTETSRLYVGCPAANK